MKLKDADDNELISRLRASDFQAMEVLYDRYGGLVYSVAFKILQNNFDAEELTQDVFISLWQQDNYQPKLSNDSETVFSGSIDNTIRVWSINNNQLITTLSQHHNWVLALATSQPENLLISGSKDSTIKLWRY